MILGKRNAETREGGLAWVGTIQRYPRVLEVVAGVVGAVSGRAQKDDRQADRHASDGSPSVCLGWFVCLVFLLASGLQSAAADL